jgi:hypothetical protein
MKQGQGLNCMGMTTSVELNVLKSDLNANSSVKKSVSDKAVAFDPYLSPHKAVIQARYIHNGTLSIISVDMIIIMECWLILRRMRVVLINLAVDMRNSDLFSKVMGYVIENGHLVYLPHSLSEISV